MKTFDCETTQRKWNSLSVRNVTDAARRLLDSGGRKKVPPESSLTIAALEAQLAAENAVDLTDLVGQSTPWEARERHRKLLAAMNRRNKDFWNGGRPAA